MNIEEKVQILNSLQTYSNLYYTFFNLCNIEYTEKIPTVCVSMNNDYDDILLSINPTYWNTLNIKKKSFVIAHECLHIIFNHLTRLINIIKNDKTVDRKILNIAADLCVNESLVRSYKFIRSEIDNNYYWLDICFPDGSVGYGHNLEYYYEKLLKNDKLYCNNALVDSHESWQECGISYEIFEKIISNLSDQDKKILKQNLIKSDTDKIIIQKIMANKNIKKNKKWESIIYNWVKSKLDIKDKEISQWARTNRRFCTLNSNFFIPTEMEIESKEKIKYNIFFFLDVSGSCRSYAQRFYDATKSIPTDKFNIRFFCFSTWVKEIQVNNNKIPMGGGTSFSIIEDRLSKEETYPDAVFVLTDGFGNNVKPKHPDRWIWMLVGNCSVNFIPSSSKKFKLKDFK